jgi:hypothetical protein
MKQQTKTKLIYVCLLISIISCNNTQTKQEDSVNNFSQLQQLEWLLSQWQNSSPEGDFYESWIKTNDTSFTGTSLVIARGDTVFSESILLHQIGDNVYYSPTVSDQNNAQPVSFKLISNTNGIFVFENKEHDFPQRIIYSNPQPDSLYARVEGNHNGIFRTEEFGMKRNK